MHQGISPYRCIIIPFTALGDLYVLSMTLLPLISRSPLPTVLRSTHLLSTTLLVVPPIILDPATTTLVVAMDVDVVMVKVLHLTLLATVTHPNQPVNSVTRLGTLLLTAKNAMIALLPWIQISSLLSCPLPMLLQTINGIMALDANHLTNELANLNVYADDYIGSDQIKVGNN